MRFWLPIRQTSGTTSAIAVLSLGGQYGRFCPNRARPIDCTLIVRKCFSLRESNRQDMAAQYCVDSQKWIEKARLLLSDGAVPVFPATLKEAMTHHALPKQKKDDRQDSYKQELSNSEKGWLSSGRGQLIHFAFLLLSKLSPKQEPTDTSSLASRANSCSCVGE